MELLTDNGRVSVPNPIEQVRQYAYQVVNLLTADPQLVAPSGDYKGKLKFPYGYGVVFTHINQDQLNRALTPEGLSILPDHMLLCRDEMPENMDPEAIQEQLWAMFNSTFRQQLSLPDIERIRWHLFPELRIETPQGELAIAFEEEEEEEDDSSSKESSIPDIIKIMDLHQEQLKRNLGDGHRVIHGVNAWTGSTSSHMTGFRRSSTRPIGVIHRFASSR